MRVLVVDDHEFVRKGICALLSAESALTLCGEAVNGREAVEKAISLRPDVVIMDITMPEMNGIDATRQIKRMLPQTKIIIVSQHEAPLMARQATAAGASGYVSKSTLAGCLLDVIRKADTAELNGHPDPQEEDPTSELGFANAQTDTGGENLATARGEYPIPLLDAEIIYRTIGESMDYGIWVCDTTGRNIYSSPSFLKLVGLNQKECSEFGWVQVLHPDDIESTLEAWQQCVRQESMWEREHRFRGADGQWHYVLARGLPVRDASGALLCWAGINLDIQKHKEAERRLYAEVHNLESRVNERTRDLESASGELRELSGKLLRAQDDERRRIARELHDGVGQLLVALNLNVSKLSNQQSFATPESRPILQESKTFIEQSLQEIRTLSYLLHPPLLDDVGLESALSWFTTGLSERSNITIQTRMTQGFAEGLSRDLALTIFRLVQEALINVHRHSGSAKALITIHRDGHLITLTIKDEGTGIPAAVLSKMSTGMGVGVGLSGMRERARQFGGELNIESTSQGTTIIARLPVDRVLTIPSQELNPDSAIHPKATILCIDDEQISLTSRKLVLESAGYQVLVARSGPEGLQLFKEQNVDIVLLDYWMTGMKGISVAAEMKSLNSSVPIVVLSGMADLPGETAGVVDRWILKGSMPVEELLGSVASLLKRQSA